MIVFTQRLQMQYVAHYHILPTPPTNAIRYTSNVQRNRPASRIILVDLIRHDNHPEEEDSTHELKSPIRFPALTCAFIQYTAQNVCGQGNLQILHSSNHANVPIETPEISSCESVLHCEFTLPTGPQSTRLMMTKPTIQSTKRMKEPIMTTPGRSRRCEMR
jgi:hypothetical protein